MTVSRQGKAMDSALSHISKGTPATQEVKRYNAEASCAEFTRVVINTVIRTVPSGGADLMNDKLQQVANQTKRISKKKDNSESSEKNVTPHKIVSVVQSKTIKKVPYNLGNGTKHKNTNKVNTSTLIHKKSTHIPKRTFERNVISKSESENENTEDTSKNGDIKSSDISSSCESIPSKLAKMSEDFLPVPSVTLETDESDSSSVKRISSGEIEETNLHKDELMAVGVNNEMQETIPSRLMEYESPLEHIKRQEIGLGGIQKYILIYYY
ncbi:hypothetical protein L9F63_012009 [Diploptera punctata]|uniref:Uncharacterized protein n=1 Tax=Diploptera punctata TaxID=6984 RepID=A0AAD8ADB6_DIPPU|nr:hypothetical protein L9F63_012009 [Diploptera punctata]